jgi:hypothetical protein
MTIETDPQYWGKRRAFYAQACFEEKEFERTYYQQILKALKRIDRVRAKLIEAQNNLVTVVTGANEHSRETFAAFYNAGGVTAEDWKVNFSTGEYQGVDSIVRGQLRVAHGGVSMRSGLKRFKL